MSVYAKSLQIDIPDDVKKDLKAEAARQGVSMKDLVTQMIKDYLGGTKKGRGRS